jgi:uncharacterized protein
LVVGDSRFEAFVKRTCDPPVRGFLHTPSSPATSALVLTHGAGGSANGPWLVALAAALADSGIAVLRCDLPFRQSRSFGPPRPGDAARDRQGLVNAIDEMKERFAGETYLGGHSYGGRQGSMVAAENPEMVSGLLLSSYPLHPPGNPARLRTEHFPNLKVPALFVQGTRDPFGTIEQIEAATKLIPVKTQVVVIEGVGHDLGFTKKISPAAKALPNEIAEKFLQFFR